LNLLHIGDLHFWSVPSNPLTLLNKRFLGIGNLLVGGRARKFRKELAPVLIEKACELNPDTALFSGDFTTTSLPQEFEQAKTALSPFVSKENPPRVYTVPGNHDCYLPSEQGAPTFARIMDGFLTLEQKASFRLFPDGIGLFQVNATTWNKLGSYGKISKEHLEVFESEVLPFKEDMKHLLILCHFPGEEPKSLIHHDRGPQLHGSEELLRLLGQVPCKKIWLHGHHHYRWIYTSPNIEGLYHLNAGAPLMRRKAIGRPDFGFHQLKISTHQLDILTHHQDADGKWLQQEVSLPEPGKFVDLQK
jgi:3',5'-cyclic AMP phosphodiesterase CpdA